jgi:glycosyltransferase involved in cell wall biosynthesis
MPPCVSVIMPVRDGERWVDEAIASMAAQSLPDFELLIIDDGSVDTTRQIANEAAQRDRRIRVIALPPSGIVAALNRGLDEARGKYLARLDADDRAHPTRLARQVDFLNGQAAVGLVGSWADAIDADGKIVGRLQPATTPAALARALAKRNPMLHSSVMWRADLSAVVGCYRAAFEGAEDYDLWLRISEHSLLANVPDCLVQYRRHDGNVSERCKLRQMFSARLAQRSALSRKMHGSDPAEELTVSPDWNAAEAEKSFYREDANLYRFLELSIAEPARSPDDTTFVLPTAPTDASPMTHDERKLAQIAMLKIAMAASELSSSRRIRLLVDFVHLHPARAVKLVGDRIVRHILGPRVHRKGHEPASHPHAGQGRSASSNS